MMKGLTYTIAVLIIGLLMHQASAQVMEEFKGKKGPVHITSQRLEAEYEKKLITFIGGVVARQEEFTLYSDRLVLFLADKMDEIDKIVAQDNVRMDQEDRKATCREAIYYYREGRVVLQGDPVVREGDNWVKGKRIIYYIEEQKSVAEGEGAERVTVTITPREVKK
jgi:lipopolysaccharide export system protein LptA